MQCQSCMMGGKEAARSVIDSVLHWLGENTLQGVSIVDHAADGFDFLYWPYSFAVSVDHARARTVVPHLNTGTYQTSPLHSYRDRVTESSYFAFH
jgi:hypothetical protein